jgi:hypothetical protein
LDTQFRQLAITKLLVKNNTKGTSIMSTAEERIQILKMIEEGKISASEGAELIRALDQNSQETKDPLKGASQPLRRLVPDSRRPRPGVPHPAPEWPRFFQKARKSDGWTESVC